MKKDYSKLASTTLRLITKFGSTAQKIEYDQNNNETVVDSFDVVAVPVDKMNSDNTLIEGADSKLFMAAQGNTRPDIGDYIKWNSTVYVIKQMEDVTPAALPLLYALYIGK